MMLKGIGLAVTMGVVAIGFMGGGGNFRELSESEAAQLIGGADCKAFATQCTGGGCAGGCHCSQGSSTLYKLGGVQDCPTQRSGCSIVYKGDTGGCGS